MAAQTCPHPSAGHVYDQARGIVTCSACGDIITTHSYEMDPAFNRDGRAGGGGGAMRQPGGFARPMRTTQLSMPTANRPSIDVARRGMLGIARQLQISTDDVEIAAGVFKLAVSTNAIGGARPAVLAACLYIVCRRNHSPHTVLDFADATKQSPYVIIGYMKTIAGATHTTLPTIDPSYHLKRFAEHLNLGGHTDDVALLALKILRAMKQDWIQEGRRPLGPCAAALVIACNAYGYERDIAAVAGMVRLSAATIELRLAEFMRTSASKLANIDDYTPTDATNPRCFENGRRLDGAYEHDNEVRRVASLYYDLVEEAKLSAAPTEERCQRWRAFFEGHCRLNNLPLPDETKLDLMQLTPSDQLHILGLRHTEPLTQEQIEAAARNDEELKKYDEERTLTQTQPAVRGVTEAEQLQFSMTLAHPEVEDLGDLGFDLGLESDPFALTPGSPNSRTKAGMDVVVGVGSGDADGSGGGSGAAHASQRGDLGRGGNDGAGGGGDAALEAVPESIEEVNELYFSEQNGWETLLLEHGSADSDADSDLDGYVIYDNEERVRHERLNVALHKERWGRGAPKPLAELKAARWAKVAGRKRKRGEIRGAHATAAEAVQSALKSKGAGQLDLENFDMLIGGSAGVDGEAGGGSPHGGSEAGMDDAGGDWEIN